jgi:LysM repeat protein
VVVSGDSLWAIARKNDTTVAKLKAANGLTSDKLKLGLKLKLP